MCICRSQCVSITDKPFADHSAIRCLPSFAWADQTLSTPNLAFRLWSDRQNTHKHTHIRDMWRALLRNNAPYVHTHWYNWILFGVWLVPETGGELCSVQSNWNRILVDTAQVFASLLKVIFLQIVVGKPVHAKPSRSCLVSAAHTSRFVGSANLWTTPIIIETE